jgi:transcriptional regulator with XRE-family HTH domain
MPRRKRPIATIEGAREGQAIAATLGGQLRSERKRLGVTQTCLGVRVGLSQSRISELERGLGGVMPLETWISIGIVIGRPLAIAFSRTVDPASVLTDAGHLEVQEHLLVLGRRHDWRGFFELPTRPTDPSHSVDVCQLAREHRCLLILEAWNRFGDLGMAARSSSRKVAEAAELDVTMRDRSLRVALCWVVRDTAANRAIVRKYPEILAARFPGSSVGWVAALEDGGQPPHEPGMVWFDASRGCLRPVRLARSRRPTRTA